ncbi:MAG TPA: hypothetical protein PLC40_10130, partial [Candidatus Hydrogenedentes bacterium]|nr:hypothetical protein [Candidatus Hydrogenedentota bacterium]
QYMLVEPLFVWPLSWWVRCSDASWWLRFPSVVAGVMTVYAGASTAGRIAGKRATLCTALVLAMAPALIYYSRDAKMYAWVFLWVICVVRGALLYGVSPHRLRYLALYIAAGTALCYTHFAAPLFLAVSGLGFLACFARTFRVVLRWFMANALIIVLALPFIIVEVRYQSAMRGYVFHAPPPDLYALYITLAHFFTAYTASEALPAATLLFFSALILLGLFRGSGLRMSLAFLVLLGLGPALILFVVSSLAPWSLFVDRYVMASALPLLLAASLALTLTKSRLPFTIGLLCCLFLSAYALPDLYHHTLPKDYRLRRGLIARSDAPRMADILREHAGEGAIVLHPSWETEPVLKWYAPEFHHILADYQNSMRTALSNLAPPKYLAFYGWNPVDVRRVVASASRVWLTLPAGEDALTDRYSGIIEELSRRGKMIFSEVCGAAILQCYDLHAAEDGSGWIRDKAMIPVPGTPRGKGIEFSLVPAPQEKTVAFELTIRNQTNREVSFQFEAVPCAVAVPASALSSRQDNESNWSRGVYMAAGVYRMAAIFRAHPKVARGDDLAACLEAPPGVYAVYLERTMEGRGYTVPAAEIHLQVTGTPSGAFVSAGRDGTGPGGWRWERLGVIRSTGDYTGLVLSAKLPEQRPEAYAVFSQLAFIREENESAGPAPFLPERAMMACPSNSAITRGLPALGFPDCMIVQGTVMDACVSLVNTRVNAIALLPYSRCSATLTAP